MIAMLARNLTLNVFQSLTDLASLTGGGEGREGSASPSRAWKVLGLVEAGFPSPAEEELRDTLSLDEFLVGNPDASFLLKVSGDSMTGAGILPGDLVIVDRGQTAKSGDIVIAEVDGEWTMKFLKKSGDTVYLVPANPRYKPIRPQHELRITGVVTAVVRKYTRGSGARGRGGGGGVSEQTESE
jgi:SOS regulatory protein LexA